MGLLRDLGCGKKETIMGERPPEAKSFVAEALMTTVLSHLRGG